VKVYLLPLADDEALFYSEGPEAAAADEAEAEAAPRGGVRGWAEQRYKSLQGVLNESERGVGLRVRRIWEWLQQRTAPDEPLLRSLRGAKAVVLVHPASLTEDAARERWEDYLASRGRRHLFWLIINAIISPLTLLLAPLPGPNLIGYWFVYRAVCHLLARLGSKRARSSEVATAFVASTELDAAFAAADHERIAQVEASFGLQGLAAYLERATAKRAQDGATRLAALNE
jgi:Mitochondrial K+-H+ exchange-related